MDELWRMSAGELAAAIARRQVSSREVVEAHLARIEEVNPRVNAVTRVLADEALAAADAADRDLAAGASTGPLHGVPFTIKENIDVAGTATTSGVPALADAVADTDAPTVSRLKAVGAIPLARTNLPEMGLRISTDNPLHGLTRNPWHPDLTAGGSSGGEGSALATGMSPLGLGNDLGGSLRNPAFCCGITSLKPTPGRVPQATVIPPVDPPLAMQLMSVTGPMARRVGDLRTALTLVAGRDLRDPESVDAVLAGPAPPRRRAALVPTLSHVAVDPAISDAVRRAGDVLADAGWEVIEAEPPELELVGELWSRILTADVAALRPLIGELMSDEALSLLDTFIAAYPPAEMPAAMVHVERHRLVRAWSAFLSEHPVLVTPTWPQPPFPHGADLDIEVTTSRLHLITPGNLLGLPSCAVPTGVADGIPTGVQVYADLWREDLCLDAAEVIEDALGVITPIDPTF
ncbi:MAG: indole acetimide hydrolase [Actinomyces sp.]|nr:MAG: indole acetimide hydrolase [Actinomyces sp.]